MKPNTAIKYSWFLILLSLGHEFSAAYRVNNFASRSGSINLDGIDPLYSEPFRPSYIHLDPKQHPEYFNGDYLLRTSDGDGDVNLEESDNDSDVHFVQPSKRGWATVLAKAAGVILALSVGASVGGIAMEAYYKLAGCCNAGYPELCTYSKEIGEIQTYLKKTFKSIDFGSLSAKNLLEDITQINYRIKEIWGDLKRIQELQEELLTELKLIKAFNTKWAEIEAQIKSLNDSYRGLSIQDLNFEFQSYFDKLEGTLLAVGGLALIGLQIVGTRAFNRYTKNQLNQKIDSFKQGPQYEMLVTARHTKAARILGVDKVGINAHIEQTVTNKQKSKFNAPRFAKVLNVISVLGGGLSIYFEVAAAIQRDEQCKNQRNNAKTMLDKGRKGRTDAAEVYKNVTDYIDYIDRTGMQYIREQLTGVKFLYELDQTLELVRKAGTQTPEMKTAATNINNFIMGIRDADSNSTRELSADLAYALANVKFLYSCYTHRTRLINYIKERCTNGTKPLKDLFADASKSFNTGTKVNSLTCRDKSNVSYFSYADMQKEWAATAKLNNLENDCVLNSAANKEDACRKLQVEKKSNDTIAGEMGLSVLQVIQLTANCPAPTLSPIQKTQVCKLRARKWTDVEIADFYGYDIKIVSSYVCPTTAAPPGRRR